MVGDLTIAEDVVQDAFERLHSGWHRLRDQGSALAYARASVLNGCRSAVRRARVAHRHAERASHAPTEEPDTAQMAADRSELMAALRALPRRQREVLVLRYYLDMDASEIAETLGVGPSTVRSTATRGLAHLANCLRGELR